MTANLENQRVEYTISLFAPDYDWNTSGFWDLRGYPCVARFKFVGTTKRACRFANAIADRVKNRSFTRRPTPKGCVFWSKSLVQELEIEEIQVHAEGVRETIWLD